MNSSILSTLFLLRTDQSLKFAGLEIKKLDRLLDAGDLDEMNFRPNLEADAYTDVEIDELTDGTFIRLGLKSLTRRILEDHPHNTAG